MIATRSFPQRLVGLVAPWVWRNERRIAAKLDGFSATEAGSALDMLKAAELTTEPALRRLFFRHAMDEARHARLFRDHAASLHAGTSTARRSEYTQLRATRQNLFERLGLVPFIAFVFLAERRGEAQFRALREHFARADRPELAALFARIGKDERFHVAYSRHLLDGWRRQGLGAQVRRALFSVRLARAHAAWRRAGRVFGDALSRILLSALYLVVLPLFAFVERRREVPTTNWSGARELPTTLAEARRQY